MDDVHIVVRQFKVPFDYSSILSQSKMCVLVRILPFICLKTSKHELTPPSTSCKIEMCQLVQFHDAVDDLNTLKWRIITNNHHPLDHPNIILFFFNFDSNGHFEY